MKISGRLFATRELTVGEGKREEGGERKSGRGGVGGSLRKEREGKGETEGRLRGEGRKTKGRTGWDTERVERGAVGTAWQIRAYRGG